MSRTGKVCSVIECTNYEIQKHSRTFCRFPRDNNLCGQWVLRCGKRILKNVYEKGGPDQLNKYYRICSDHFLPSDFKNPRHYGQGLKPGSLPTQKLPDISLSGNTSASTSQDSEAEGTGLLQIKEEPLESVPEDILLTEIKIENTELLPYDGEYESNDEAGVSNYEESAVKQEYATKPEGIVDDHTNGSASPSDQNSSMQMKLSEDIVCLPKQKRKSQDGGVPYKLCCLSKRRKLSCSNTKNIIEDPASLKKQVCTLNKLLCKIKTFMSMAKDRISTFEKKVIDLENQRHAALKTAERNTFG